MRRLPDPDVLSGPPFVTPAADELSWGWSVCPVVSGGAAVDLAASVLSAMKIVDGSSAAGLHFRYLGGYREEFDATNAVPPSMGCLECVSVIVR